MRGKQFSKIHRRELNEHYANYFNLTKEARHYLAESLGMTHRSLSEWMLRKWRKENKLQLESSKQQPQTLREDGHGKDASGMWQFILVVIILAQFK